MFEDVGCCMKIISVWQPWASLIIHGHKTIETRSWKAPDSLLKQEIGIAATKNTTPDQRFAYNLDEFQEFYAKTGLPPLDDLPRGCVLGTVTLNSSDYIDEETIEDITDEERAFGWYMLGRYAWRVRNPKPYPTPIPARGKQGIWDWNPNISLIYDALSA